MSSICELYFLESTLILSRCQICFNKDRLEFVLRQPQIYDDLYILTLYIWVQA